MVKCYKVNLSAGYCGTEATEYIKCEEEVLKKEFYSMVCEHADQYSYLAHFREIETIMEEDEVDEETAQETSDAEYEDFYMTADEHSGYKECTEEEWKENNGTEW